MKCLYCNAKIEEKWNYCSECGHGIERHNRFVNLIHRHLDQIKRRFSAPTIDREERGTRGGITISITTGFGQPQVSMDSDEPEKKDSYNQKRLFERRQPKETIEPEVIMNKTVGTIIVSTPLPGVKTEDDVEIISLPNSVELRAYGDEKGYFKILNIPNTFGLVEKKLKDGKLRLQFSM